MQTAVACVTIEIPLDPILAIIHPLLIMIFDDMLNVNSIEHFGRHVLVPG